MKQELVRDWMTCDVITISPNTSLAEAHRLMQEKQIRRLPVLDHDRVVGIVTLGDVRGAEPSQATSLSIWEANDLLAKLKVYEIMTRKPATISQDTRLAGETLVETLVAKIEERAPDSVLLPVKLVVRGSS